MNPAPQIRIPRPFLDLVANDSTNLAKVVLGFEKIIIGSFRLDPVRGGPTSAHVRERYLIIERIFRMLRCEKSWGIDRILDHLPTYLHAELNRKSWEPDDRIVWAPNDGR